jgi:fucose permease
MAGRRVIVVNAAGAVQGIVLVTAPAASTVFTSPTGYGLTDARYGAMFVPQVVTAIIAALTGSRLSGRLGLKRVYLAGLGASLVGMAVLALSQLAVASPGLAYPMLLIATAFIGVGFGLTVPALNSAAAAFAPGDPDQAVLVLNALLGLGTALAPVFVAVFVGLGFWWGLPVLSAVLLTALIMVSLPLDLTGAALPAAAPGPARRRLPGRFWLFAAFAVLYGIAETTNGNWAQLDMTTEVHTGTTAAAVALTAFWAMVTFGRVGFATLEHAIPPRWTYRILPLALTVVFLGIAALPSGAAALGVLQFGLAGLCCSALLPLTISFGQTAFRAVGATVPGALIASYQAGYGIAAFGIGPLLSAGVRLSTVFAGAAVVALAMAALAVPVSALGGRPATPDEGKRLRDRRLPPPSRAGSG